VRLLNVGGNSKVVGLPPCYDGWEHILLDIDPAGGPDIVADARNLYDLPGASFDAVYCSHNLEHYYAHDAIDVVLGFLHVLKDDGFAHIRVPDIGETIRAAVEKGLDIGDTAIESPAGPISVRDVIYGWQSQIQRSGHDYYAHKNGFTKKSLSTLLIDCGFKHIYLAGGDLEIMAFAFRQIPGERVKHLLGLESGMKK
jgi:SAM-dependent methyltransferase